MYNSTYSRHPEQRLMPGALTPQTAHTGAPATAAAAPTVFSFLGIFKFFKAFLEKCSQENVEGGKRKESMTTSQIIKFVTS